MMLIAVFSAVTLEALIQYGKTKVFRIAESALITGFITGYVLSSDEAWWKFVLAASLAIISKYVIRLRKKHIFNPAGFGIFLTLIFFSAFTQWKGTYVWPVLVPFGIYCAWKIHRLELIIGYAGVSIILFGAQAVLQKVSLGNIFGYFSYFYIFIMLIEPMTTPMRPLRKFLFGAGAAACIFIVTQAGVQFDAELFSLLMMNLVFSVAGRFLDNPRRA